MDDLFTHPLLARMDSDRATQVDEDVVIYDGTDEDDVLYEGPVCIHPNGWLELEGTRLLSPSAVHHIDIYDDVEPENDDGPLDERREQWNRRDGDGLSGWEEDDAGLRQHIERRALDDGRRRTHCPLVVPSFEH